MLKIEPQTDGNLRFSGRWDASQGEEASHVLDALTQGCALDLADLSYISSLGLSLLLKTQKRLSESENGELLLTNVNAHLNDVLHFAGFNHVFKIEVKSAS